MVLVKGLLQDRQWAVPGQSFDRFDAGAFHLDGEGETAAAALPVDPDGAGTANAVRTPDVGSGQVQLLRRKSASSSRASTVRSIARPFTVIRTRRRSSVTRALLRHRSPAARHA